MNAARDENEKLRCTKKPASINLRDFQNAGSFASLRMTLVQPVQDGTFLARPEPCDPN